jgi:hypothetical protein
MPQMSLAEHDHMIEALASDGAEKSFSVTVLPRRSRRCRSVANDPSLQNASDGQRHISCFHVPGDIRPGADRNAPYGRRGPRRFASAYVSQIASRAPDHKRPQCRASDARYLHQQANVPARSAVCITACGGIPCGNGGTARATRLVRTADVSTRHRRLFGTSIETVSRSISQLQRRHALDRSEPRGWSSTRPKSMRWLSISPQRRRLHSPGKAAGPLT